MQSDETRHDVLRRGRYTLWARRLSDALRHDAGHLDTSYVVHDDVWKRIDQCATVFAGGGNDASLTVAAALLFWLGEAVATNGDSTHAQRGFDYEYPEHAQNLTPDDWTVAFAAFGALGRVGRAAPWVKLGKVLAKAGCTVSRATLRELPRLRDGADALRAARRHHLAEHYWTGKPAERRVDDGERVGPDERVVRTGYARRARIMAYALRAYEDRLDDAAVRHIDDCQSAYAGGGRSGGRSAELNAAARFMFVLDEAVSLEGRSIPGGAPFDAATEARLNFEREYPDLAARLSQGDSKDHRNWRDAVAALRDVRARRRGRGGSWERLARIFAKTGYSTIDGENLKKACIGQRDVPGRVLGTMRWGRPRATRAASPTADA